MARDGHSTHKSIRQDCFMVKLLDWSFPEPRTWPNHDPQDSPSFALLSPPLQVKGKTFSACLPIAKKPPQTCGLYTQRHSFIPWLLKQYTQETIYIKVVFYVVYKIAVYMEPMMLLNLWHITVPCEVIMCLDSYRRSWKLWISDATDLVIL